MDVNIELSWKDALREEFEQPYFAQLAAVLKAEVKAGYTVYPHGNLIFNAFDQTPFDEVKVVLIGQDPYHGAGQAHGLCFSVPEGITPPPSLLNVFKELETDLGLTPPAHGNLQAWATQGVLMLNSVLTVRANAPTSHQNIGWQRFTDAVIRKVSDAKEGIVFLLWGNYARTKKGLVNTAKHYVLEAAHPSPLARGAFFGCRHFSITNELLTQQGKSSINWGKQEQKQE